jgi:hypothetical protein
LPYETNRSAIHQPTIAHRKSQGAQRAISPKNDQRRLLWRVSAITTLIPNRGLFSGLSSDHPPNILELIRAIRKAFLIISDSYRSRAVPE